MRVTARSWSSGALLVNVLAMFLPGLSVEGASYTLRNQHVLLHVNGLVVVDRMNSADISMRPILVSFVVTSRN